jgi:glycosyltransferase involved in cell wall biosynthesis
VAEGADVVVRIRPVTPRTRPSVSVVIPNYNYGHFLWDTAKSALAQTEVDVEVVIVDNASTDNSAEVAGSLAEADSRVKCVYRTSTQGPIENWNEAVSTAEGDYIVLLCADDLLAPGSLARSTALLESRPDVALVYGHCPSFVDKPPVAQTAVRSWTIWSGPEWVGRKCRDGYNFDSSPGVTVRRSVMDNVKYDPTIARAADFKVSLDATRYGAIGRIDGAALGFYRVHGSNLHLNEHSGYVSEISGLAGAFEKFFSDGPVEPWPAGEDMDKTWRRTLARLALDEACRSYDRGRVVPGDIEKLEDFATSVFSDAPLLPEWRGLTRRKKVGAARVQYVPTFFAAAVRRRVRQDMAQRRRIRTGV